MDESTFHQSLILFFEEHFHKKFNKNAFWWILLNRNRTKMNISKAWKWTILRKLDVHFINRCFKAETDSHGRPSREFAKSTLFYFITCVCFVTDSSKNITTCCLCCVDIHLNILHIYTSIHSDTRRTKPTSKCDHELRTFPQQDLRYKTTLTHQGDGQGVKVSAKY